MQKIKSLFMALTVGIIAINPKLMDFRIPMQPDGLLWQWMVLVFAVFGFMLMFQKIHVSLKALSIYLFFDSFVSQSPYFSFNAYICVVACLWFYVMAIDSDFNFLIQIMESIFWISVLLVTMQHFGCETLLSMQKEERYFNGTLFSPMREGSFLAVMAPFLLIKNKLYIIPLLIMAFCSQCLGFCFALIFGIVVYLMLEYKRVWVRHWVFIICTAIAACFYASLLSDHIQAEFLWGRWPIWGVIIRTWAFDTMRNFHGFTGISKAAYLNPSPQAGPFSWKYFLFGHGMDTFLQLFPYYKYDPNPFGQAHNDWLQLLWEIGLFGFIIVVDHWAYLIDTLFKYKQSLLLSGIAIISVDMFFAFPGRMTQTILIIICFGAICMKQIKILKVSRV